MLRLENCSISSTNHNTRKLLLQADMTNLIKLADLLLLSYDFPIIYTKIAVPCFFYPHLRFLLVDFVLFKVYLCIIARGRY